LFDNIEVGTHSQNKTYLVNLTAVIMLHIVFVYVYLSTIIPYRNAISH